MKKITGLSAARLLFVCPSRSLMSWINLSSGFGFCLSSRPCASVRSVANIWRERKIHTPIRTTNGSQEINSATNHGTLSDCGRAVIEERRDRVLSFRAFSQRKNVVLKRCAGVSLIVRAIQRVDAGNRRRAARQWW